MPSEKMEYDILYIGMYVQYVHQNVPIYNVVYSGIYLHDNNYNDDDDNDNSVYKCKHIYRKSRQ